MSKLPTVNSEIQRLQNKQPMSSLAPATEPPRNNMNVFPYNQFFQGRPGTERPTVLQRRAGWEPEILDGEQLKRKTGDTRYVNYGY